MTIKAFYIKEADKPSMIKRALNLIDVKNNQLTIQPIQEKCKEQHITAMVRKIHKICKKRNIYNIVISKNLQKNKQFIDQISKSEIEVFNGRWLLSFLTYNVTEYIVENTKRKKEETEIAILVNNPTKQAMDSIHKHATEYKRVNIVSNNVHKFKYLESKLYNDYGIMITVTNNKRKSLVKSELILNFDFSEELINQYNIYEEAIIVNILGNITINKKRFNGLCINDYEIYFTRQHEQFAVDELSNFYLKDMVEERLYRVDTYVNLKRDISRKHYKIKELYGKNGKVL